jgi:hypothetical protein
VPGSGGSLTGLADDRLAGLVGASQEGRGDGGPLREAQERLADLAVVLPLFRPEVTAGWREGVEGIRANPTVEGPLWNSGQWSEPEE